MINETELLEKVKKINVCKSSGERAPHKPLLILYALAKYLNEQEKFLRYNDVRKDLIQLLKEFGRPIKIQNPQEPFYRLKNDGFWRLSLLNENNQVSDAWLKKNDVFGMFSEELFTAIDKDRAFTGNLVEMVLMKNFPETLHDDILIKTGLMNAINNRRISVVRNIISRDWSFRSKILELYDNSCAICGYNLRFNDMTVGLEAAHIKWHQAHGPSTENNGIALCAIHHKLFDQGAFTLDWDMRVQVSVLVEKSHSADIWLGQYENNRIALPEKTIYKPDDKYIQWHVREVFKEYGSSVQ